MDVKAEELMKKCEEGMDNPEVMGACKVMLEMMEEKKVELPEEPEQSYFQMAENLSPEDVPKVLKMALEISSRGDIEDTELKNAAFRLFRSIEMG